MGCRAVDLVADPIVNSDPGPSVMPRTAMIQSVWLQGSSPKTALLRHASTLNVLTVAPKLNCQSRVRMLSRGWQNGLSVDHLELAP